MKKLVTSIALALICALLVPYASFAALPEHDAPNYNNVQQVFTTAEIDDGSIWVTATYTGIPNVTTGCVIDVTIKELGEDARLYLYEGSTGHYAFTTSSGGIIDEEFPMTDATIYWIRVHYAINGTGGDTDHINYTNFLLV